MAMTSEEILAHNANASRTQELERCLAGIEAELKTTANLASMLSQTNMDAQRRYQSKAAELAALKSGNGPGITPEFGMRTSVDNFATEERTVGQGAAVDFIQANPECSESDAVAAWEKGVAAWLPDGAPPTHNPEGLLALYTRNLVAWGKIQDATWDSFRAFVVATPRDALLNL